MENTEKILREFAEETRDAAKRQLGSRKIGKNNRYGVASGKLQKSLSFQMDGTTIEFTVGDASYGIYLHEGVSGTKVKRDTPFAYTTKQPPTKAILEWMKAKPVRLRDKDGRFVKKTPSALKSAAYLIGRSIKEKGIEGVQFYTIALETMWQQYERKIGEAMAQDALEMIDRRVTVKFRF